MLRKKGLTLLLFFSLGYFSDSAGVCLPHSMIGNNCGLVTSQLAQTLTLLERFWLI